MEGGLSPASSTRDDPGDRALPEPDRFRAVMGRFATGVSVVTARWEDAEGGMTVNALLSVSLDPPSVLVSLGAAADTTPLVERSGRFGVSLLAAEQMELSERFASRIPSSEKFRGVACHRSPSGIPLLDDTLGTMECEVVEAHPFATHLVFLGRVTHLEEGSDEDPLVFWGSHYATRTGPRTLRLPDPRPIPLRETPRREQGT